MEGIVSIYALVNLVTQEPFYVGATISDLKKRLQQHLARLTSRPGETIQRRRKLMKLLIKSKTPSQIMLLTTCQRIEADYYESYYYNLFVSAGFDLIQSSHSFQYTKQQEKRTITINKQKRRNLKKAYVREAA